MKRQKKRALILRRCAAVSLVSWIAAIITCFSICHCPDSTEGHDHAAQSENGHSHETDGANDSECPDPPGFCASLDSTHFTPAKQVIAEFKVASIKTVDLSSLLPQNPIGIENDSAGRQAKERIWVFTPEVCLGPAIRSLAPPHSSLS